MAQFTDHELSAILAGLHHIQDRLAARRIAPDSLIGKLLTKDGEYGFPTADDLEPLIAQLTKEQLGAPPESEPTPLAIDAMVKIVLLHPTAVYTAEAITTHGYNNLPRYVDQMLADNSEDALISQEVMFISGTRPLTVEEHEAMYGDLPYPNPTEEEN